MLTVGELFAGIGGIGLGLEMTGKFKVMWQVENDGYCNKVLERHWPEVERWGDIRDFNVMLSHEGCHAKTYRVLERELALEENAQVFGLKCSRPFAWYDRDTSSWRTFQRSLKGEWEPFLGAWPRAGMTVNGIAYRLKPLVPYTSVIGSSLLPTPNTMDATGKGRMNTNANVKKWGGVNSLGGMAATGLWPKELPPCPPGELNPEYVEWLMGFPIGWTGLDVSEIRLCHRLQSISEGAFKNEKIKHQIL